MQGSTVKERVDMGRADFEPKVVINISHHLLKEKKVLTLISPKDFHSLIPYKSITW